MSLTDLQRVFDTLILYNLSFFNFHEHFDAVASHVNAMYLCIYVWFISAFINLI